jgi:glycosyltransferase involved in cell wall biosynthesis
MNPFGISIISSYVPRQCGIATFTNDLAKSILSLNTSGEYHVSITALNNVPEGYKYGTDVKFEIKDRSINDFKEAAYFLNLSNTDIVSIQHEFGLYGGEAGANILYLMEKLTRPVVTTLHTILEHPTPEQMNVMTEIAERSSFLVVQSKRSFKMLERIYKIPNEKIRFIPHGAHDVPFLDPAYYKDKFHLTDKKVILTFGLLGPGKGLEDVINGLTYVVEEFPDTVYVILGATHPNVKKAMGESYRNSLENLVKKNNLDNNVLFINRFVDTKELLEFLLMSDIYVSPYQNKEQIVSGTLTYALACGKAVVSTPYWYAEELLSDDKGVLVPFKDPKGMGDGLNSLLQDEGKRNRMRKKAYDAGRQLIWQNVGKMYSELFFKAVKEFKYNNILPVPPSKFNTFPSLPEVNLNHMKNLTDDTGILQHATYSIPNPHEGYCTDDNVRGLLVSIIHMLYFDDKSIDPYISRYLQFVYYSFNPQNGSMIQVQKIVTEE